MTELNASTTISIQSFDRGFESQLPSPESLTFLSPLRSLDFFYDTLHTYRTTILLTILFLFSAFFLLRIRQRRILYSSPLHPDNYTTWTRKPCTNGKVSQILEYEHGPVPCDAASIKRRLEHWQVIWMSGIYGIEMPSKSRGFSGELLDMWTPLPQRFELPGSEDDDTEVDVGIDDEKVQMTLGRQMPLRIYSSNPWPIEEGDREERSFRGPVLLWSYPFARTSNLLGLRSTYLEEITYIVEDDAIPAGLQAAAVLLGFYERATMRIIWATVPPQEEESTAGPHGNIVSGDKENMKKSCTRTITDEINYWIKQYKPRLSLERTQHYPSLTAEQIALAKSPAFPWQKKSNEILIIDGSRAFGLNVMRATAANIGPESIKEFGNNMRSHLFDGCEEGKWQRGKRIEAGGLIILARDS